MNATLRASLLLMAFLAIFISVQAIADTTVKPTWISGSSDDYPSGQYLVGVGESAGQERAKDKARADLVKTIKVSIDASSRLKERVSTNKNSEGTTEEFNLTSFNDITTSSQVEMKNIQIIDTWYDEKNESYFALAVLARAKASSDLMIEMKELDLESSRHISRAKSNNNMLDKIAKMNKAIKLQQRRNVLENYLIAIDSSSVKEKEYELDGLKNEVRKIKRQIPISVNVIGQDSRALTQYAKGGLGSLGYIVSDSTDTKYVIDAQLIKEPVIYKDELYWVFASLELKLRNGVNNKVIGACSWEIKEASQHKNRVNNKILDTVNEIFSSDFHYAFNAFINTEPCEREDD